MIQKLLTTCASLKEDAKVRLQGKSLVCEEFVLSSRRTNLPLSLPSKA
jgi:hypothetical protein